VTSVRDLSYFDMASMPLTRVSEGQSIQTLVNHDEEDGQNVIAIHHDPGDVQALHSHDVEQFVIVLEGTLQQGNRLFPAGTGFFTPRQRNYGFRATDDAPMVRVEWRPSPSRFATDHPEPRDGEPVASGAEV
jgi:quercetin dioxygenase-like cupin family protein